MEGGRSRSPMGSGGVRDDDRRRCCVPRRPRRPNGRCATHGREGGGGAQRGHAVLPSPPCQRPPPRRRGSPPLRPARGRAGARWRTRAAGGGRAWPGRACHGRAASSRRRQAGDAPTVARASRRTPHRVGGTPPPCRRDAGAARRPVAAADFARPVSASAAARHASGPCAAPRTHAGACRSAHGRWSAAPRPRALVRTPTTDAVNGALGRRPRGARYTRAPSPPRGARSQAVWPPAPPPCALAAAVNGGRDCGLAGRLSPHAAEWRQTHAAKGRAGPPPVRRHAAAVAPAAGVAAVVGCLVATCSRT